MRANKTTLHFFYGRHLIKLNKITFFPHEKSIYTNNNIIKYFSYIIFFRPRVFTTLYSGPLCRMCWFCRKNFSVKREFREMWKLLISSIYCTKFIHQKSCTHKRAYPTCTAFHSPAFTTTPNFNFTPKKTDSGRSEKNWLTGNSLFAF